MKHKVLVTGAAGYIGSVLCERLLDAGHQVVGVDNLMYGQTSLFHLAANPGFQFVRAEVMDLGTMRLLYARADVIIPLAALVGAAACDRNHILAYETNVLAIDEMVKSLSPEQLIIYPNTNSGYGIGGEEVCTEETPMTPISLYGQYKKQGEDIVMTHPKAISLRLATVFGVSPRMRFDLLVNDFCHRAYHDRTLVIYEGHARRNYVHVSDVAKAMEHCIQYHRVCNMAGQVYNLGNDDANSTKIDLARLVADEARMEFGLGVKVIKAFSGTDPDRRDYIVSSQKLAGTEFHAVYPLQAGIHEVMRLCGMLPRPRYRND